MNPFIKLTRFREKQEIFILADKILSYNKHFQENYTEVEIDRLTIDVIETPEEISAMIQKYYDDQMRMEFIKAALTGLCSDSNRNISAICHESVAIENMISSFM